jgi:hypothetical protein
VETAAMLRAEPRARTRAVVDRVRVVAVMMFLRFMLGLNKRLRLLAPLEKRHGDALQRTRKFSKSSDQLWASLMLFKGLEQAQKKGQKAFFRSLR